MQANLFPLTITLVMGDTGGIEGGIFMRACCVLLPLCPTAKPLRRFISMDIQIEFLRQADVLRSVFREDG